VPAPAPGQTDPLAFFAGKVVRSFDRPTTRPVDLNSLIDRANGKITSATKQLALNYKTGLLTVDAPQAQGAAGFLKSAGRIALSQFAVESLNEYASVVAISLDAQPLAASKRILIQAMTEDHPHGFKTESDKIASVGGPPFNVRKISIRITLNHPSGTTIKVTALDENGYPIGKEVTSAAANAKPTITIQLPEDCLYTLITR
jgi:hypothetical protein